MEQHVWFASKWCAAPVKLPCRSVKEYLSSEGHLLQFSFSLYSQFRQMGTLYSTLQHIKNNKAVIPVHSRSPLFNSHQKQCFSLLLMIPLCDSLQLFFPSFVVFFCSAKKTNRVTIKKRGKSLLAPFLPLIEKSLHAINNAAVQRSGAPRSDSANLHKQYLSTLLFLFANPNVSEYKCLYHVTQWTHEAPPCWFGASDKLHQTVCGIIFFFFQKETTRSSVSGWAAKNKLLWLRAAALQCNAASLL